MGFLRLSTGERPTARATQASDSGDNRAAAYSGGWGHGAGQPARESAPGAAALTERLRGGEGNAAIGCAAADVGEAAERERAATTAAGACLRRLAEAGEDDGALGAATAAANDALAAEAKQINRGATVCAARLRWRSVADCAVYHWRRLGTEVSTRRRVEREGPGSG